ncbi:MAG: PHP domain-containing protein [Elusimicrobia bacterium]|nr:PHP domain-containing protein [Elusimicrobiota bacterium]
MRRIDLHAHSSYSDGTNTPAEVVRLAKGRGVELFALTDHDSVSGLKEAAGEAKRSALRFLRGVEINTREEDNLHVLGYGVDADAPGFEGALAEFRSRRQARIAAMVEKLRALGVDIALSDVRAAHREVIGRPHIADALRRRKVVSNRHEAFERFLAKGKPAYIEPMGPTVREAIELIRSAGGWASLAHPGCAGVEDVERYAGWGLEGIEVYYPTHTQGVVDRLLDWAWRFGLTPTGGSDYHGPKTGREEIGGIVMPQEVYESVVARLGG